MSDAVSRIAERAAQMRREFDLSFSRPIRFDRVVSEDLLAIRVGEQRCAIRLSEIAGLHAGKTVTRVPGGEAALCGIAGFRGIILPVYDLHRLLSHTGGEALRWLVVASAAPVAFAFAAFDGQLRVPCDEIAPHTATAGAADSYARDLVRTEGFAGPILHLPSIIAAVGGPAKASGGKKGAIVK